MNDPARDWLDVFPVRWAPPPVRRWLLAAVSIGIAGDTLLRGDPGAGLAVWLVAVLLVGAGLARAHGPLGTGRAVILGLGVAAAATLIVRSAPPLTVLAIGLVGASVAWAIPARPWAGGLATNLAGVIVAVASLVGGTLLGAILGARGAESAGRGRTARWAVVARGALAAAPVLLVVGALFVGGDPVFERYAERVLDAGLERVLSHLVLAAVLAWVAGGVVYALAAVRVGPIAPSAGPLRRYAAEAVVALILIDLLFAAFLGVQARALFGGRAFVEATAGMTYAEYARSGFFQLVLASIVALPAALAAAWVVPRDSGSRRAFVAAACGLAAGVILVLASAAHRMALYVDAYGLTEARVYATAVMIWVAATAAWLAATIVADRTERFVPGALVAAFATFFGLVAVNPGALVVRVNADRAVAGETPGFDVRYGVDALGTDAVPALIDAVERLPDEEACRVAAHLTDLRLEDDPRGWTVSRWRARRALADHEAGLRGAGLGCDTG